MRKLAGLPAAYGANLEERLGLLVFPWLPSQPLPFHAPSSNRALEAQSLQIYASRPGCGKRKGRRVGEQAPFPDLPSVRVRAGQV
jgi:hypothetical protein